MLYVLSANVLMFVCRTHSVVDVIWFYLLVRREGAFCDHTSWHCPVISPLFSSYFIRIFFYVLLHIVICFLWWQRLMKYWLPSQCSCYSLWFTFTSVILRFPEFKPHWTGPQIHRLLQDLILSQGCDERYCCLNITLSLLHTPGYNVRNDCNLYARIMRRM